jgi:flagellar export protein FliJ
LARFEFRLKSLLAIRGAERDRRRMELAGAVEARQRLLARCESLERELEGVRARSPAAGPCDLGRLQAAEEFASATRAQLAELYEQDRRLARDVERRREAIVDADREVRVLERLRQRQLDRFSQHQARLEQKYLDEIAGRAASAAEEP